MPRLSELYQGVATATFSVGGMMVAVQYDPRKYNNRLHVEIKKEAGDESNEYVLTLLECLIVGWDLQGDDGELLPVSYQTLDTLPQGLISRLANAIVENETNPKSSRRSNGR